MPASFQSTMNILIKPYLRKFVIVFFDNILVYSKSLEDHISRLDFFFFNASCLIKFSSRGCLFAQESIEYLGHTISRDGVSLDLEKIRAMITWPTPTTIKQLRGFLGLTGFYRMFILHYASSIVALLLSLTY